MTIDDEKFFAWLDGELSPQEAAQFESEVTKSPDLTRAANQHRAMQARLRAAFDPIAQARVPERLQQSGEVIHFAAAKQKRDERRWPSVQWVAMAATLAIGFFGGTLFAPRSNGPVEVKDGRLYAASALNHALDTELASAPEKGPVRIGLTFRDQSGVVCRTFTDPQATGLACREGLHWQLRGLFAAPEGQGGAYRMAAGMDPNLAALVDSTMADGPLSAEQERAAKERSWN